MEFFLYDSILIETHRDSQISAFALLNSGKCSSVYLGAISSDTQRLLLVELRGKLGLSGIKPELAIYRESTLLTCYTVSSVQALEILIYNFLTSRFSFNSLSYFSKTPMILILFFLNSVECCLLFFMNFLHLLFSKCFPPLILKFTNFFHWL